MRFDMDFTRFQRRLTRAAIRVAIVAAFVAIPGRAAFAAPSGENADSERSSAGYLRVTEQSGEAISLEIAERQFMPADGRDGPRVGLVAVAHIADGAFFDRVQEALNEYDVVLYESVTPPGTSAIRDKSLTTSERIDRTRAGLKFTGALLQAWFEEKDAYPDDLASLRDFAAKRDARLRGSVRHAFTDGWGNRLHYDTVDDKSGFELTSYGADGEAGGEGPDSDITRTHEDPAASKLFSGEQDNLQSELANALDLAFQLNAIDYSNSSWQCADMAMDDLQRAFADRGIDFEPISESLVGTSVPAKFAKMMLKMIPVVDAWTEGRVSDMFKVVLIEMLGNETFARESLRQMGDGFAEVIIHERNDVAINALKKIIERNDDTESVAIFYGAGHMNGLHDQLVNELGYEPIESDVTWRPAISLDLTETQFEPAQLNRMRLMMRRMFRQAMAQQRRRSQ